MLIYKKVGLFISSTFKHFKKTNSRIIHLHNAKGLYLFKLLKLGLKTRTMWSSITTIASWLHKRCQPIIKLRKTTMVDNKGG
ncbi:MAG TPA: hypothetical protein DEF42_10050 [Desulfosporosinus sp.]|nr:hypothetical protein [Desulfosporosinus sp.]